MADFSAPANQNHRIIKLPNSNGPEKSLIFPLKFHKPGLHLLHCSQHYLPCSYTTSDRALNKEWIFKPKVQKSFHSPPQNIVRLSQEYTTMLVPIVLVRVAIPAENTACQW